jgi:hypothetical protein
MRFLGYTLADESAVPAEPPSVGEYTVVDGPFAEAKELVGGLGPHGVPGPPRGRRVVQAVPWCSGRR